MGYVAIVAILCALVFLIRLQMMKKQVKDIVTQLESYHSEKSEMKVAVSLTNRLLETLSSEINHVIDREREAQASKGKVERELKEAISGMSHDLRTPLTAIIGYMQLVEQTDLSEEERNKYLSIAKQRALRLQQLIQNFFSLSVVEADDYPLQMEQIEFTALVKDVLLSYYDQFQEMDAELKIDMPDEQVRVMADRVACNRVIENILLNTIQHAEGAVHISLSVEGNMVYFTVHNEMSHADIKPDQVLDKFYTADQTRRYSGGLGLAIVKSLMKRMDGTVDVQIADGMFKVMCTWGFVE